MAKLVLSFSFCISAISFSKDFAHCCDIAQEGVVGSSLHVFSDIFNVLLCYIRWKEKHISSLQGVSIRNQKNVVLIVRHRSRLSTSHASYSKKCHLMCTVSPPGFVCALFKAVLLHLLLHHHQKAFSVSQVKRKTTNHVGDVCWEGSIKHAALQVSQRHKICIKPIQSKNGASHKHPLTKKKRN